MNDIEACIRRGARLVHDQVPYLSIASRRLKMTEPTKIILKLKKKCCHRSKKHGGESASVSDRRDPDSIHVQDAEPSMGIRPDRSALSTIRHRTRSEIVLVPNFRMTLAR
jgi:hypothetical protein